MNNATRAAFQGRTDRRGTPRAAFLCTLLLLLAGAFAVHADDTARPSWYAASSSKLANELSEKYGAAQRAAIERGLEQVGDFWRDKDGDAAALETYVRANYAGDPATRDSMIARFERMHEALDGHMNVIGRVFREQADLDYGPILPFDETS